MKAYQMITDRIIASLKEGVVPWQKPYITGRNIPTNLATGNAYRGINVFMLGFEQIISGYPTQYWVGFNQLRKLGGHVTKGEKGTPVVFFKILNEESEEDRFPLLKYSYVWNIAQCYVPHEKLPKLPEPFEHDPIEACEQLIVSYADKPQVVDHFGVPYYSREADRIGMPPITHFVSPDEYYATFFHEMVHSTGHENRLGRKAEGDSYAFEELVAELGASYLAGIAGIEGKTIENAAAYIQAWLARLEENPKWIVQAANKAQAAADYIRGEAAKEQEVAA